MKSFFNPDNFLWQFFGRIADYFILSCLWAVCSTPILTAGAASIALYDTVAHCIRGGERDMVPRFFGTFKRELGRGCLMILLWAVVAYILNVGHQILTQMAAQDSMWQLFSIVYFTSLLVPLGIGCWAIALESRFTYSFTELHRTALTFTFLHLPQTLGIVALFVITLNVLIYIPYLVMFLPCLMAALQSLLIEKVFAQYLPAGEENEEPAE